MVIYLYREVRYHKRPSAPVTTTWTVDEYRVPAKVNMYRILITWYLLLYFSIVILIRRSARYKSLPLMKFLGSVPCQARRPMFFAKVLYKTFTLPPSVRVLSRGLDKTFAGRRNGRRKGPGKYQPIPVNSIPVLAWT